MSFKVSPIDVLFQFWRALLSWEENVSLTDELLQHNTRGLTTYGRLCEGSRFSYDKSARTPIEGTSLHRQSKRVEKPRGILSLFTCLRLRVNPPWQSYVMALWSRSFFLRWITVDPSPWGNFTPPTKHECGETLRDFEFVYDLFTMTSELTLPEAVTQVAYVWICTTPEARSHGYELIKSQCLNTT